MFEAVGCYCWRLLVECRLPKICDDEADPCKTEEVFRDSRPSQEGVVFLSLVILGQQHVNMPIRGVKIREIS